MIDLGANAMTAEEGVNGEGKIESCTACGHRLDFSLRCKNEYLAGKEVQFDGVEKIHCIGLGIVKNFLDGT